MYLIAYKDEHGFDVYMQEGGRLLAYHSFIGADDKVHDIRRAIYAKLNEVEVIETTKFFFQKERTVIRKWVDSKLEQKLGMIYNTVQAVEVKTQIFNYSDVESML